MQTEVSQNAGWLTMRVKTDGKEGWEGIHATRNSTHGNGTQQI